MKSFFKYLVIVLLSLSAGGYLYSKIYYSYLSQRSKAFYSQGLENVKKDNPLTAIFYFGCSIGAKENYESYIELGEIYSIKGYYNHSISTFEKALLLIEDKQLLVDLDDSSLEFTKSKINKEIIKNINMLNSAKR